MTSDEIIYELKKLENITQIPIAIWNRKNGILQVQPENFRKDYESTELKEKLLMSPESRVPRLYIKNGIYYYGSVIIDENEQIFLGPVRKVQRYQWLELILLVHHMVHGEELRASDVWIQNGIIVKEGDGRINLFDEEIKYEKKLLHHTYEKEQNWKNAILSCNCRHADELIENIFPQLGNLSRDSLRQNKYVFISIVTILTRIAIEDGVPPYRSYAASDDLINKIDLCRDDMAVCSQMYRANRVFIDLIQEYRAKRTEMSPIEKCKVYISNHYREKIRLETLARVTGLNAAYLSHLFSDTEGVTIKEFLNQVRVERAGNLLKYSDSSFAEIGEYVGLGSQSYFGKIFKKYTSMTPQEYYQNFHVKE